MTADGITDIDIGPLTDGVVDLRLVSVTPADPETDEVLTYRFSIRAAQRDVEMGGISLRVGSNDTIERFRGQIGFEIDPAHRGHGYATRACRLVSPVASQHGLTFLWVTCDPDNIASRRTLEKAGARLIDVVEVPRETRFYAEGSRQKCRYQLPLAS
jgi:predicted acetyltransferase